MSTDELALLLEQNYKRDLALRCMMYATVNHEALRVYNFSKCCAKPFRAVPDERMFIKCTCLDYADGSKTARVTVYERDQIVLQAELNRNPGDSTLVIKKYISGSWEKKITTAPWWVPSISTRNEDE